MFDQVFELIDIRSFSNIWYWITVAGLWSLATHPVLGIPFDIILNADKSKGGMTAFEQMARIAIDRRLAQAQQQAALLLGLSSFVLSTLFLLGFFYDLEIAQAVFLLAAPLTLIWVMGVALARRCVAKGFAGSDLQRVMIRHRRWKQALAAVSLFITALWGMYQNLTQAVLGG